MFVLLSEERTKLNVQGVFFSEVDLLPCGGRANNYKIRGTFNMFCPFAFMARNTALIFVECITFYQTNVFDDVQIVFAVFTGHKLHYGIYLSITVIN